MAARVPGTTLNNSHLERVPRLSNYSTCLTAPPTHSQIPPHFIAPAQSIPSVVTFQIPTTFPSSTNLSVGSKPTDGWTRDEVNECIQLEDGGKCGDKNTVDQMKSPSAVVQNEDDSQKNTVKDDGESEDGRNVCNGEGKDDQSNETEKKVNPDKKSSLQLEGDLDLENNEIHKDLPEELLAQFSARKCELCVVQMNSALQSKMHYNGKQHQKKVRMFMNNWFKEHGEPNSKKLKKDFNVGLPKIPDDKRLYCECCDLSFTSMLHAQQHYMGRNHQRVASGQQPLKSGYFNKTTHKWQRFPPWSDFTKCGLDKIVAPDLLQQKTEILITEKPNKKQEDPMSRKGRFYCELCNIGATSQEQLDMHFKGGKHKKAERLIAHTEGITDDLDGSGNLSHAPPADSILASVIKYREGTTPKKSKGKDYSIYRTPSGKFYCQPCNLTVHCESQFIQHLDSKKHKSLVCQRKVSGGGGGSSSGGCRSYYNGNSKSTSGISSTSNNRRNGNGSFSFLQTISSVKPQPSSETIESISTAWKN